MIDIGIYAALGFLVASLLALMLAPPLWNRAVRLTRRRIESTLPMSVADIQAEKDQLRAEFAIELRRVEVALEKAKDKAVRELVEVNKRRVELVEARAELDAAKARLQEKENANRVLEQTIRRRLPELESRLKSATDISAKLQVANNELRSTSASQSEALRLARGTVNTQLGDIKQLRGALEAESASSRGSSKSDATLAKENRRLNAELSKLKQELSDRASGSKENELLRAELSRLAEQVLAAAGIQGTALPAFPPSAPPAPRFVPPPVELSGAPHVGPRPVEEPARPALLVDRIAFVAEELAASAAADARQDESQVQSTRPAANDGAAAIDKREVAFRQALPSLGQEPLLLAAPRPLIEEPAVSKVEEPVLVANREDSLLRVLSSNNEPGGDGSVSAEADEDAEPLSPTNGNGEASKRSLARSLMERRSRQRDGKGRKASLAERLKNVSAEASDL